MRSGDGATDVDITVIIPCFNEVGTIQLVIEKVLGSCPELTKEVVVVDDCSVDGTRSLLERFCSDPFYDAVKTIFHDSNQGKGAALRTGISRANGRIILIQDADLEYDPSEYQVLLRPILDGLADVVYGSRFMGGLPHRVVYFWHRIGNGFLTTLSNMFTNLNLTDMETCYKAFRGDILKNITIEEDRFGFEPEITAKIAKSKCRVFEVGISYYGRTYEEGKKIGWRDGFRAIYCIIKYNCFR